MVQLTLGEVLRAIRETDSLRAVAHTLGISPTHLSDLEHNRRVPSEALLAQLAAYVVRKKACDVDVLPARTGRLSREIRRYLAEVPEAGRLFHEVSAQCLTLKELQAIERIVDRLVEQRRPAV